jgi:hypothetical protein
MASSFGLALCAGGIEVIAVHSHTLESSRDFSSSFLG